ncbi:hypothetical protein [Brevibacillus fulvus]|uniref:Photosynthesis system II assembly factor Ycf48/Hcf136-like domain-containing protein n=1 Tax=Brevibacillus fulvus TaxID=1125967 RepID=A0A938XY86_9BACL|nr:hypothetical protein [Brevibacillus fulvus]MBM7589109.1 hypothetical protein [Brevibacillus fulvus]
MNRKRLFSLLTGTAMLLAIMAPHVTAGAESSIFSSQNRVALQSTPFAIGDNWKLNTKFSSYAPADMIYTGNQYVGVGDHGTIIKSTDGINWQATSKFADYHLSAIGWSGQQYVVFGAARGFSSEARNAPSEAFVSTDSLTWTKVDFPFDEHIRGVVWNNGTFVAVSPTSVFLSADGQDWTQYPLPEVWSAGGWGGIVCQNNRLFIGTPDSSRLMTSQDGQHWIPIDGHVQLNNLAWFGGQYIGVGNGLYTSADGVNWKKQSAHAAAHLTTIAANGARVTAIGWLNDGKRISLTSTDGKQWVQHDLSNLVTGINILLPANGGFVGTGSPDDNSFPVSTYAYYTKDGANWSTKLIGTTGEFGGVATNGKRTVAVGLYGAIVYTDNGLDWQSSFPLGMRPNLFNIAWGNNKFVAVGNYGAFYSADGVYWSKASVPYKSKFGDLRNIVWTGKIFVATDQVSGVYVSRDGVKWTAVPNISMVGSASNWLQSMVWDGKRIVAAVQTYNQNTLTSNKIMQSSDGVHWTNAQQLVPPSEYRHDLQIAYNGASYVAISQYNPEKAWVSGDGNKWTEVRTNLSYPNDSLEFVKSFDGYFVAYNESMSSDGSEKAHYERFYISQDGKNWTELPLPPRHPAFDVHVDEGIKNIIKANNQYIAVGSFGQIISIPRLPIGPVENR